MMKSFKANAAVLGSAVLVFALGSGTGIAEVAKGTENAASSGSAAKAPEREFIPGADRMTSAERDTYRRRMAEAGTPDERTRIRAEYAKAADAKAADAKAADTRAADAPAPAPKLVGDPARGAALHQGCFGCHGIERYMAPVTYALATFTDSVLRASGLSDLPPVEPKRFKGRATSLSAVREGVIRRNEFLAPKMTPQEIEDVVAYLNASYYKFPQ